MYFASTQSVNSFDTYLSFLTEILQDRNKEYIEIFKQIISETQKLIDSKDYYSVSNDRFEIVSFLAEYVDIIKSITIDNIRKEDFEKLHKCLKEHNALEV